ncbi:hypothetical protein ACVI1J_005159 [Bradyrhizobium diazoefficiens]
MRTASVVAILLATCPNVVGAQVDCNTVPAGPSHTDCFIGLGRLYGSQSAVAAGKARVQSDAARHSKVTGSTSAAPKSR